MSRFVIANATIVTVDASDRVLQGHILIQDDKIKDLSSEENAFASITERLDASGCIVMPGLVQAHVHLSQVLFRGLAEEMPLLDWLRRRIFPLEAAHTADSLFASASLGIAELLLSGTTSCLDMGTVRHADSIFAAAKSQGFRLTSGKAMMDVSDGYSDGLVESRADSLESSVHLAKKWHNESSGLLQYAMAPRFILSCSQDLLKDTVKHARSLGVRIHSHASENPGEVLEVKKQFGVENIVALHNLGLTGNDVILAHCVHLSETELQILRESNTNVAHCPTTNLKLASGIADIESLAKSGINVGIGCDGAPCNNRLDGFIEMHMASVLQKPKHGATALPAAKALRMATMGGAKLLGRDHEIGSIEIGKKADLSIVELSHPRLRPLCDPITTLVHSCTGSDVRDVFVNGKHVVRNRMLTSVNQEDIVFNAELQIQSLLKNLQLV